MGGLALSAGVAWGSYLLLWFGIASGASRFRRELKAARSGAIVAKTDRRDAWQVLANGGVFAGSALAVLLAPDISVRTTAQVIGAAALAAAGADTLATECGILWGRHPWSLRRWQRVAAGTSGAVSLIGLVAMVAGAMLFATLAWRVGLIDWATVPAVALAAIAGAMTDTLIGAWWQTRRWCAVCQIETEQPKHRCGTPTRVHGGLPWLDNDAVNATCTVAAALLAAVVVA